MEKKIDVMIVGAQKSGTTSLLRYLGEHPQCVTHPQREFAYFGDPMEYQANYKKAFAKYYADQIIYPDTILVGKSASLYTNEKAIERLYKHNPRCEIILLLRNPVDRTYSSFLMEKNAGSINYNFNEIERILENPQAWEYEIFINFSLYANHIKNFFKYFPKNQVNIFLYEEFESKPVELCQKIFKKLNIDSHFIPDTNKKHNITLTNRSNLYAKIILRLLRKRSRFRQLLSPIIPNSKAYKYGNVLREINKTSKKHPEIDKNIHLRLNNFFKSYNTELEHLLNIDLSNWKLNE